MERLDGTVRRALAGVGVPDSGQLAELTRAWPTAVGDAIARAAWPQRLTRDGTLVVSTISSTWAFELGRMAPEIAAKVAQALPRAAPLQLRFVPGPVPEPPAPPAQEGVPARPTPAADDMRTAAELAAGVEDPDLRSTIARAAAASLARSRDNRAF